MSILRKSWIAAGLAVVAIGAAACSGGSSSGSSSSGAAPTDAQSSAASSPAGEKQKIGFVSFDIGLDPFATVLAETVESVAKEKGFDIEVVNGKNDLNTQIAGVQQFISNGVDAILLYPGDPEGLVPVVQQAAAKDIPVFTVNLGLKKDAPVVTYTGADDYLYGKEQGELVVKAIGDKGNVALLMGSLGTSAQIQRTAGITDFLKDYPNIKLVEQQPDDWAADKSLALVQNWANKYAKGELNAVVAQGPQITSVAKWAKEKGREEIKFIAGDYPADVQKAIVDGLIFGTINQDPKEQAVKVVDNIYNWLNGAQDKVKTPEDFTPLPIITQENAASTPPAY